VTAPPIRVLLVDDQALFRSGLALTVAGQPDMDAVGEAADGAEAARLVQDLEPDIVLMDIRMPGTDGVEACRQIFAPAATARRSRPVRVIVLTTFNFDDRATAAIRYGASGFLLKDCTPAFLTAAIRTVHAGNAVLASDDLVALIDGSLRPQPEVPPAYRTLTDKEREIFHAVARGLSNNEVARSVHLSESTIKTHVGNILRKLNLRDRVQLVVFAADHGLRRADPTG
jgi:DNA-binding NarL/FixJ family response regulator